MVTNITNLSRSGLYDWMVQRATAVVLAAYTIFMVVWLVWSGPVGYQEWQALFAQTGMRIFSLMALLSLSAHAWVGMWTISGDYLNERALGKKALWIRLLFQLFCGVVMFSYVAWGIQVLWRL